MAMLFGRFEIQSEISKSETAVIYKATDVQSHQTVALKTQSLKPLGSRADAYVDLLIGEGESSRDLVSQNIAALYGAGEVDGQFCAAMEYVQGNSVATMLARKDGFSIWDLLDITRQVCAGLEHAAAKRVVHCSLEPAKIMVQWDGMVKILGYGISNMSLIEAESGKNLGRLMAYCSPEQIRGEAIDVRSNLFTLGSILYEMVTGRKAFDAEDPVELVNQIANEMPPDPSAVNSKIQATVGAVIVKALAKDPAERYQTASALLDGLESCKEGGKRPAADSQKAAVEKAAPQKPVSDAGIDSAARAAAAGKFASAPPSAFNREPATAHVQSVQARPGAATGAGAAAMRAPENLVGVQNRASTASPDSRGPGSASGARMVGETSRSVSAQPAPSPVSSASSAAVAEPGTDRRAPRFTVDPMMAQPEPGSASAKFSDLSEMPPLKAPLFAPSAPDPAGPAPHEAEEQPGQTRSQARDAAQSAMRQIATVPPRLMLFSIAGAVALILVIAVALFLHVRSEDDESTAAPKPAEASSSPSATSASRSAAVKNPLAPPPVQTVAPSDTRVQPSLKARSTKNRNAKNKRRAPAPAPAPVVLPGRALIDSSPQGAQFQVDGRSDPSYVTPFELADLNPGKHIISISKPGYSSEIRSVDVVSGAKASLVLHLAAMNALIVVNSTPAGAEIVVDGKPTGRVTPAQFSVEKGSHTVLLRKQGYLDETVTSNLSPAQNFQYAPQLRALGNVTDMKTVGRLGRLFGHGGDSVAGMGSLSVRTQPKGAQVAINHRLLDKTSPVDVMLGPGNYIIDVTLTGFWPIHKVVIVEKGGKASVEEILERQ